MFDILVYVAGQAMLAVLASLLVVGASVAYVIASRMRTRLGSNESLAQPFIVTFIAVTVFLNLLLGLAGLWTGALYETKSGVKLGGALVLGCVFLVGFGFVPAQGVRFDGPVAQRVRRWGAGFAAFYCMLSGAIAAYGIGAAFMDPSFKSILTTLGTAGIYLGGLIITLRWLRPPPASVSPFARPE